MWLGGTVLGNVGSVGTWARGLAARRLAERHRRFAYLVYTMGKVGSQTVYRTLREALPFSHVAHVHFLSERWTEGVLPHTNHAADVAHARSLKEQLAARPDLRLRVITLVREPVSRDVSGLFEMPADFVGARDVAGMAVEEIAAAFDERRRDPHFVDYTISWLDTELREWLGIDVYAEAFPRERGYVVQRHERCDLLVMRLESLDRCYADAFRELADLDVRRLVVANRTADKPLGRKSREFRRSYRVHPVELARLYASRYVRHFYTPDEIAAFTRRWARA